MKKTPEEVIEESRKNKDYGILYGLLIALKGAEEALNKEVARIEKEESGDE